MRRCRWQSALLFFSRSRQPVLDGAGQILLPLDLDLRILLGHPNGAVAGDLGSLDSAAADLLPPRDIGPPEGVRAQPREVAVLGLGYLMERILKRLGPRGARRDPAGCDARRR